MEGFSREQLAAIEAASEWGYVGGGMRGRPDLWRGRKILDVGMGGGPHSLAYIALGASGYFGVDPLVGTDEVRDMRSVNDPSIPGYHAFPYSTDKMMSLFPQIKLLSSTMEEAVEELRGEDLEVALMDAVTEHLQDPEPVFEGIWRTLKPGGVMRFSHCNYYSWIGHHEYPRSVEDWDSGNASHNEIVDWKHLDPTDRHYTESNLNRVRLSDLRSLTENYFEIAQWREDPIAIDRLTPEIRGRYNQYSLSDLLSAMVYVTGVRRDEPLGRDFSDVQFYHPDEEYNRQFDYSHEDVEQLKLGVDSEIVDWIDTSGNSQQLASRPWPWRLRHLLLISNQGEWVSHSDNNYAGDKIIGILQVGDVITLEKGFETLRQTFTGLNTTIGEHPRAKVKEETPESILNDNYNSWRITSILRDNEGVHPKVQ